MIKLNSIFGDCVIYEGLVHSSDIDTTMNALGDWASDIDYDIRNSFGRVIRIYPKMDTSVVKNKRITVNHIDNLVKRINILGWYISSYRLYDSQEVSRVRKYDYRELVDIINKRGGGIVEWIQIEPKYDVEVNKDQLKDLYHLTPSKNDDKIKRIGLVPRSLKKASDHPERIYFSTDQDLVWKLAPMFMRLEKNSEQYSLYKVNVEDLIRYNGNIRFFRDPNVDVKHVGGTNVPIGVYTLSNVPPQFLNKISTRSFDYESDPDEQENLAILQKLYDTGSEKFDNFAQEFEDMYGYLPKFDKKSDVNKMFEHIGDNQFRLNS